MFGPPVQRGLMAIDVSSFHQIASYESTDSKGGRVDSSVKETGGMKLSPNIEMHAWSAIALS